MFHPVTPKQSPAPFSVVRNVIVYNADWFFCLENVLPAPMSCLLVPCVRLRLFRPRLLCGSFLGPHSSRGGRPTLTLTLFTTCSRASTSAERLRAFSECATVRPEGPASSVSIFLPLHLPVGRCRRAVCAHRHRAALARRRGSPARDARRGKPHWPGSCPSSLGVPVNTHGHLLGGSGQNRRQPLRGLQGPFPRMGAGGGLVLQLSAVPSSSFVRDQGGPSEGFTEPEDTQNVALLARPTFHTLLGAGTRPATGQVCACALSVVAG